MGNNLGAKKKTTTIMKITGETIKIKTPVTAGDMVNDYPGMVLLDAEMVKHYGIRAKPLEPQEELKAKRLYFLVELPKLVEDKGARRVRSGINMSAKERLESLKLGRRSASDLAYMRTPSIAVDNGGGGSGGESFRVKLRLPKVEVARLMKESRDEKEVGEKIMKLCMEKGDGGGGGGGGALAEERQVEWKSDAGREGFKGRSKRVGFSEELIHTWM